MPDTSARRSRPAAPLVMPGVVFGLSVWRVRLVRWLVALRGMVSDWFPWQGA
ncbi:hypothetical protein [Frankia sp. AgKG'84/4]|nr:hypothetical protein [Frankia sp. AgKG'84/4]